ncbi:H-X9-DG-CTERM domain-containing protein [Nostoc sp. FACHB-110]
MNGRGANWLFADESVEFLPFL